MKFSLVAFSFKKLLAYFFGKFPRLVLALFLCSHERLTRCVQACTSEELRPSGHAFSSRNKAFSL